MNGGPSDIDTPGDANDHSSVACDRERVDHADAYDALPVSLVVTDPNAFDNPIVYVNPAFTRLTGYSAEAACGRNCRFLQGPLTDPEAVRRLREAVAADDAVTVSLLNYRADGSTFLNALHIAPVISDGKLLFFMGVQGPADEGDAADRTSAELAAIYDHVSDHTTALLSVVRSALGDEVDTDRVSNVLASRLNALAQLYGGMFRLGTSDYQEEARLGAYLARVCSATHLADKSYNTRLNTHFVECSAELRTAATIGLLLSELLANAFDESNPYDTSASIRVSLDWVDGELCLSVADDGGKDGADLMPEPDSIGARIFDTLGRQIGVRVELDDPPRGNDRSVRLFFPTLTKAQSALS